MLTIKPSFYQLETDQAAAVAREEWATINGVLAIVSIFFLHEKKIEKTCNNFQELHSCLISKIAILIPRLTPNFAADTGHPLNYFNENCLIIRQFTTFSKCCDELSFPIATFFFQMCENTGGSWQAWCHRGWCVPRQSRCHTPTKTEKPGQINYKVTDIWNLKFKYWNLNGVQLQRTRLNIVMNVIIFIDPYTIHES